MKRTVVYCGVTKLSRFNIVFLAICSLGWILSFSACSKPNKRNIAWNDEVIVYQVNGKQWKVEHPDSAVGVKAMLASRITSLERFQDMVLTEYFYDFERTDTGKTGQATVRLFYKDGRKGLTSILSAGISQAEISMANAGGIRRKAGVVIRTPYSARNRRALEDVYILARRRAHAFGEGDVAFYDLAETSAAHINTPALAYIFRRDSSEKGYINTFNHITAQAFITSLYSEGVADLVADLHERKAMPELTTGKFTEEQLQDTINYPVDNYVDMINNELGQELGKRLTRKYQIRAGEEWSEELLVNYLNDLQSFYCWSFGIGMKPYAVEDELVKRFTAKLNAVIRGEAF